ncbi:hypothetical protein BV898_10399 [Hypsibius exemplaris]|uniref:Uncharacterized protein n=1 Tax=Hypsibius exemplaris TaxID=2072580 RepID=A0A1W0WJN6_HYPEX|nr:hypothetical protein BV898_10399 [Hypsibius exemplaris]
MPLRFIARYLMNHPEIIDKLANSYPFRRAAQLGASLFFKSQGAGLSALQKTTQVMETWYGKTTGPLAKRVEQAVHQAGKTAVSADEKLMRMKRAMEDMQKKLK